MKALDRPFPAKLLAEARRIARQYHIVVSREDGRWYGRSLELPRVFADGKTSAECVDNTIEACAGFVAYLLENGKRPPAPASSGNRTEQVNVRLSAEERLAFETAAKRKGFEGMADFIRAAAVEFSH